MYSREVEGATRSFGVSGRLWHGVLVMFDRESGSLWTQLDGRAIQGAQAGARLEHVPSTFTTWERWRAQHPDTLVLEKDEEERDQAASHYADYFADPDRLFLDRLDEGLGGVGAKDVVFGVRLAGDAVAVTERLLAAAGAVSATVGGRPVAFLRDPRTGAVVAVDARLGERVLLPEPYGAESPAERFRDALGGTLHRVDELVRLRVDRAYWYAWKRTHPASRVLAD